MVPEVVDKLAGPDTAAKAGAAVAACTSGTLHAVAAPARNRVRRSMPRAASIVVVTDVPHV
jgi:hypothetical protein